MIYTYVLFTDQMLCHQAFRICGHATGKQFEQETKASINHLRAQARGMSIFGKRVDNLAVLLCPTLFLHSLRWLALLKEEGGQTLMRKFRKKDHL